MTYRLEKKRKGEINWVIGSIMKVYGGDWVGTMDGGRIQDGREGRMSRIPSQKRSSETEVT